MMEDEAMTSPSNRNSIFSLVLCAGVALRLCGTPRLGAQVTGGTISGTVTDASGGLVPNAQVTITNTGTNVVTTVATSNAGFYSAPNLLAGTYRVTAASSGFSTAVVTGV